MKPIKVFLRTCYHSPNQDLPNRTRPAWFSKRKCFENFKKTINNDLADYYEIFDAHFAISGPYDSKPYYLEVRQGHDKIINEGTEAGSFLKTMDYALSLGLPDETIIYFLEDDYLHLPNWCEALIEGLSLPGVDYVSGLDHGDKYRDYPDLVSKLFVSKSYHWRTTPSTTNTFACKLSTLRQDAEIHRKYSENLQITQDHSKFVDLCGRGRVLVTSVPGFSTHCVPGDLSPIIDWEKVQRLTSCQTVQQLRGTYKPKIDNDEDF